MTYRGTPIAKRVVSAFAFIGVFSVCTGANAQVGVETAKALVSKTGLSVQLESLEPQLRATMAEKYSEAGGRGSVSPPQMRLLYEAVGRSYNSDRMLAIVANMLARKMSPDDLEEIDAWYSSESGKAIDTAERRAGSDRRSQDLQMREATSAMQRATRQRQKLIEELVRATRQGEVLTDFVLGTALAMQAGAAASDPTIPPMSMQKLREAVTEQRPSFLQEMEVTAGLMSAKVYAPVSDDDLYAYISFVKTRSGKHFYDAVTSSLEAAMNSAALSMGRELGRMQAGRR